MTRLRGKGAAVGVVVASGEILDGKQPPGSIGGESTSQLLRAGAPGRRHQSGGAARRQSRRQRAGLRADLPRGAGAQAGRQAGGGIDERRGGLRAATTSPRRRRRDHRQSQHHHRLDRRVRRRSRPSAARWQRSASTSMVSALRRCRARRELDRPLSPASASCCRVTVDHTYQQFLARVAKGRGKAVDAINAIAQGRVWAGVDALQIGLVDRLGSFEDAVKIGGDACRTSRRRYGVRRIEPELSWPQQLLLQLRSTGRRRCWRASAGQRSGLGAAGAAPAAARAGARALGAPDVPARGLRLLLLQRRVNVGEHGRPAPAPAHVDAAGAPTEASSR